MKPTTCYIAFGANIGRPRATLARAIRLLANTRGIELLRVSKLYSTEPIGPAQPDFLNGALKVRTMLDPLALLQALLAIEQKLGRVRREKWGPRKLDLDVLTYGDQRVRNSRLNIPHPRYHRRRFVLAPLCDIAPSVRHPRLGITHRRLLSKLTLSGQRVTIVASWNGKQFSPYKAKKIKNSRSSR